MIGAGTDTSFFVLDTAMAELMRRPELMAKLQAEVRNETPDGQQMVEEEDLAGMAYLKAVVKETLRLHPPLPLLIPHFSTADCADVDGYHVLSGTRIFINVWAIGRDPDAWQKPEEFAPERFMEGGSAAAVDFRGSNFEFMPFGAGRRMCPGLNFGLIAVEIMLANLVYCHDWALPAGMKEEDIDMSEMFGISVRRKEKLELLPKPRV
jgi:cytochrome P450